ncbi:VOC family protein [Streptomyces calidiresistens]|uniref:VOC domain-containing protein n=1 Tax=Streptomyces calidiresistens TaxID=1485586 RepID=A0A7W3T2E5_9ACTN|nr:VOC family protein [Streptomyces calidiresistens]MBB0229690.1 hypothetical protein [Streptomyces calidiresistens]
MDTPTFHGGVNLAMKIPEARYEATVAFYRETLGLPVAEHSSTGSPAVTRTHSVEFGPITLWLDRVDDSRERAEVWLEVRTDDLSAATTHLARAGTATCDEVEPFDDPDTRAHWIGNPAGIVHLLAEHRDASRG